MSVGTCLQKQLLDFPANARDMLAAIVLAPGFRGVITAQQVNALAAKIPTSVDNLLLLLVPFAQCYAIPPVSDYPVGVIAQGKTGNAYFGANMEYKGTALSFTVHGEQSATTNAWLNGEQGLTNIAISAAPCGYCRQFLYEITTAATLEVLLVGQPPEMLTDLIPQAFGPNDLGVTAALQATSSIYYGVIGGLALVVGGLALAVGVGRWRNVAVMRRLAYAAALAALLVTPIAIVYGRVAQREGFGRNLYQAQQSEAYLSSYAQVPAGNVLYGRTGLLRARGLPAEARSAKAGPERELFPGFVLMALAIAGAWLGWRSDAKWPSASNCVPC